MIGGLSCRVAAFAAVLVLFDEDRRSWKAGFAGLAGLAVFIFLIGYLYTLTSYGVSRGTSISSFFQTIAEYTVSESLPPDGGD
ncbi:MAG: hypothetical protein MZU97_07250 [Bacillus subtilis]|nr:hypothetical protein [Bacillus subtilis]